MNDGLYVIWSIEHTAWWRADALGYTPKLSEAGHYGREEAERIVRGANIAAFHECMIPVASVDRTFLDLARCRYALDASVKLQSHYAELLNMHDGGERIGFADADAWIARLKEMRETESSTSER